MTTGWPSTNQDHCRGGVPAARHLSERGVVNLAVVSEKLSVIVGESENQ